MERRWAKPHEQRGATHRRGHRFAEGPRWSADGQSRMSAEQPPALRVPRPSEPEPRDEMTMAREWLVHPRGSAVSKVGGLDREQLRGRPTPTANSLGGILVHLGLAERLWLRAIFAGEGKGMTWGGAQVA